MMSKRGWEVGEEEDSRFLILDLKEDGGFPEVEATGVLRGGDESEIDARMEAEDGVANFG